MRVGIDGYNLGMARGTGIATYAAELATTLRAMGYGVEGIFGIAVPPEAAARETAFFDALHREPGLPRRVSRYQRVRRYVRTFKRPILRDVPLTEQVDKQSLGRALPNFDRLRSAAGLFDNALKAFRTTNRFVELKLDTPPDVMHWTYPVPVAVHGIPNIYTLHDLVPLKLPHTTLDDKEFYGRMIEGCLRRAAQICTVSEASKRDIVERYGLLPDRITNTYQTATALSASALDDAGAATDAEAIEGIFGLPRRGYFLYFGAIEPKKNVGRLIEAYLALQSATPLVIVGARAWQAERELHLLPGGGASGAAGTYHGHRGQTIVRLDYLSHDLLAKLARGARAVVFPSLYEGFGLPVLEAMQLGTPVITSDAGSLPEVAGDAGLFVDPYDVAALRMAMARVDGDEALRKTMSERGVEQAKRFARERYQVRLTELYQAAMARG